MSLRYHGVEQTPNKSQHRKLHWRRKLSRCSYRDSNSQSFDHESSSLPAELSRLFTFSATNRQSRNLVSKSDRKPDVHVKTSFLHGSVYFDLFCLFDAEISFLRLRTQSYRRFFLSKPGVGQDLTMYVSTTATNSTFVMIPDFSLHLTTPRSGMLRIQKLRSLLLRFSCKSTEQV